MNKIINALCKIVAMPKFGYHWSHGSMEDMEKIAQEGLKPFAGEPKFGIPNMPSFGGVYFIVNYNNYLHETYFNGPPDAKASALFIFDVPNEILDDEDNYSIETGGNFIEYGDADEDELAKISINNLKREFNISEKETKGLFRDIKHLILNPDDNNLKNFIENVLPRYSRKVYTCDTYKTLKPVTNFLAVVLISNTRKDLNYKIIGDKSLVPKIVLKYLKDFNYKERI